MKTVYGKIFLSLEVSAKNARTALTCISHKHRHIMTIEYNLEWDL